MGGGGVMWLYLKLALNSVQEVSFFCSLYCPST